MTVYSLDYFSSLCHWTGKKSLASISVTGTPHVLTSVPFQTFYQPLGKWSLVGEADLKGGQLEVDDEKNHIG